MAASYPAGFDTMSDPGTNLSGPPTHATMHNQVNDVVEAIEAELGLNPSGASATVVARLDAIGVWTSYTPAWSGTLGNGSISGSYTQVGKLVNWEATLIWGSTTSHAAAAQTLSLPVAIGAANALRPVGYASAATTGPSFVAGGLVMFTAGTVTCQIARMDTDAFFTNLLPMSWANGSQLIAGGSYRCV